MLKKSLFIQLSMLLVLASIFSYYAAMIYLGSINPGYSHLTEYVSELGKPHLPSHGLLNSALLFLGISFACFAYALKQVFADSEYARPASLWTFVFALTLFVEGLFPCEGTSCTEPSTFSGYMHIIAGLPAIFAAPLANYRIAQAVQSSPHFLHLAALLMWLAKLGIVAIIISVVIFPLLGLSGLGQRVGVAFIFSIPVIVAFKLLLSAPRDESLKHT